MAEKHNSNIDIIEVLTPFIMMASGNFSAHYMYSLYPLKYASIVHTPYFILAREQLILIAADLQSAVIFNNAEIVEYYSAVFDDLKRKAQPLLKTLKSMEESIAFVFDSANKQAEGISGFGSHPCIANYYDREMIDAHIPPVFTLMFLKAVI